MFDRRLNSGIAIGIQDTSGQLLTIFTAVMSHKALMAFSLGLNIAQSELNIRSFVISNILFSLAGPIGIGIGIGISDLPPSLVSDICNSVLQGKIHWSRPFIIIDDFNVLGVAGGTFLYITFFEVLPHELNVPSRRLTKLVCVLLGFTVLAILLIFSGWNFYIDKKLHF